MHAFTIDMDERFLTADDLDSLLRFPHGRSERLAKRGEIPHIVLPTGDIRFSHDAIDRWLAGDVRVQVIEGVDRDGE